MNKIKSLLLGLVFSLSLFGLGAYAQDTKTANKPVLVSSVNIKNAKLISQVENTFGISFDITNKEGVQSDLHYSIILATENNGKYETVDQMVYEDVLSVGENTSVTKNVVYSAPEMLSGKYSLIVDSTNSTGFPFGRSVVANVSLSPLRKGLEMGKCLGVVNSKKTTLDVNKVLKINSSDNLEIECNASNQIEGLVIAEPVFEIRRDSVYGERVPIEQKPSLIEFKTKETKTIYMTLPSDIKAGKYIVNVYFKYNQIKSNIFSFDYLIDGVAQSIINISTDSDYYKRGATAIVKVLWTGESVSAVDVKIMNKDNALCGSTLQDDTSAMKSPIEVYIKRPCAHPHIVVSLQNSEGQILSEKNLSIQTVSREISASWFSGGKAITTIFIILLVLLIATFLLKKRRVRSSSTILPLIAIGISLALFPISQAKAYTYTINDDQDIVLTISTDRSLYPPQSEIRLSAKLQSFANDDKLIDMSAVTVGNQSVKLFPDGQILLQGERISSYFKNLTAPPCSPAPYTCPGSYEVDFTVEVMELVNPPSHPCSSNMVFVRSPNGKGGRIDYLGISSYVGPTTFKVFLSGTSDGTTSSGPVSVDMVVDGYKSYYKGVICNTHQGSFCYFDEPSIVAHGFSFGEIPGYCGSKSLSGIVGNGGNYACGSSLNVYTNSNSAPVITPGMHLWEDAGFQVPLYQSGSIKDSAASRAYSLVPGNNPLFSTKVGSIVNSCN